MDINRRVEASAAQFSDDTLRLAKRIGTDNDAAIRIGFARGEQFGNLALNRWMREYGQAKGRLCNQNVASNRFERRAGGVETPLIIPRHHHPLARMLKQDLRRTQNMSCRMKADLHAIGLKAITISDRRTHLCAITQRHDRKRFWRGPNGPMPTAGMVGMTMRHQSAFGRAGRVDPHVRRLDINAVRMRFDPMLGCSSGDIHCPSLKPDMGCRGCDVNQRLMQKFGLCR